MTTRRRLLQATPLLALAGHAWSQLRPVEHLIPLAVLQAQLAKRFPYKQPVAGDLVTLDLRRPRLVLLPAANRIGATVDLRLFAPAIGVAAADGSITLDFQPHYEPRDRTIRMTQVEVQAVRIDGVPAQYRSWLDRNAPALLGNVLSDQLLYTLTERDNAALVAFGWQLGAFKVVAEGLKIRLDPLKR